MLHHVLKQTTLVVLLFNLVPGCRRDNSPASAETKKVVLYCSMDEAIARPILAEFEKSHDLPLSILFDSEAGKTTGLVQRIVSEARAGRPRADVFWSSELFSTIRLAGLGLLHPYDSPTATDIPDRFKDSQHRWTAYAVRGRVIAFDGSRVSSDDLPNHWEELVESRFAERLAMANPLFGTTRGHMAAMFAFWGRQRAQSFLMKIRDGGVLITDGNSAAVRAVMSGNSVFAATDTDDVWLARQSVATLDLRYPDMGGGGTLLIPCSLALIAGGPNLDRGRKLVDFLLSREVEKLLAESKAAHVPVRPNLLEELGMAWPPETLISFDAIAEAMPEAEAAIREILLR